MAEKYTWTDWITHKPGHELPIGTYAKFEFHGFLSREHKIVVEGLVTSDQKGHPSWYAADPYQPARMITRYRLRIDAALMDEEVIDEMAHG